ncbi:hypothetical protein QOT17_025186 [Balamuthia mandrillaris]
MKRSRAVYERERRAKKKREREEKQREEQQRQEQLEVTTTAVSLFEPCSTIAAFWCKQTKATNNKYELFGDSEKALSEVRLFLNHLETVQVLLGEVEERLQDASSLRDQYQQKVDQLNALIQASVAEMEDVAWSLTTTNELAGRSMRRG